jgi:hypothetical protein
MNKSMLVASFAALSLSASLAHADEEALGREGGISVRTAIPVFTYESTKPATGDSTSKMVIGPNAVVSAFAVDYWLTKDITLGGALQYSTGEAGKDSTALTFAPSVGYRVAVGNATLWPKLQPYYVAVSTKTNSVEAKGSKFGVAVEVPYLWQRGAFFYGPVATVRSDFTSKLESGSKSADGDKQTALSLGFQVGGTF